METAGSKQAKKAFNRMHGTHRSMPPGVHTKGKTADNGHQNGMGHKAPATTKGNGRRMASQKTRSGPGFATGHKAPSMTHGHGKRRSN